jgi:hypothetical protein
MAAFGIVREFGFLYCDLTGAGFLVGILAKKALTLSACRDEATTVEGFVPHFGPSLARSTGARDDTARAGKGDCDGLCGVVAQTTGGN